METSSLATGDWNGDGKADLAAANFDAPSITIFRGNGDGTFQPGVHQKVADPSRFVTAADFNGDRKSDLAFTMINRTASYGTFAIMTGNGDGTFSEPIVFDGGHYPNSVAAGDWNGDGRLDVAVTDEQGGRLLLLTRKCP